MQRLEYFSKNYNHAYKINNEDLDKNDKPIGKKANIEITIQEIYDLKTG
ncbi:hypothetical protein [Lacinutrix mariniflava]|nr:hypothetical protein [Lacinutrix mariniflava]